MRNPIWRVALLFALMLFSTAPQAATCIDLPPIDGSSMMAVAPAGYVISAGTPDIVDGNGFWPSSGTSSSFVISDVNGTSNSGGQMLYAITDSWPPPGEVVETIATTLTGLTIGSSYTVPVQWQQAQMLWKSALFATGGSFRMTVLQTDAQGQLQEITNVYTSPGVSDPWQTVDFTFTAIATTATVKLGSAPIPPPAGGGDAYESIVMDAGGYAHQPTSACSFVKRPQKPRQQPEILCSIVLRLKI